MPPKNAKSAKGKQKSPEEKREESLQAVVLADSFETRFRPFTLDRPRCLLPLANTPIIEYTFEFLASNGVQDVFVYCGNHTEQIEEYICASKWSTLSSPFRTLTVLKAAASSVGDCMRDLDSRDLVKGDFLVVSGDVVSNVKLEAVLARHRLRREKDKNAIMTMVLRETGVGVPMKRKRRRPVFVIDPRLDRCLHYEEIGGKGGPRYVMLDPDFLTVHAEIDVREDLVDPHIDICTPDVLAQWSENFDYQSLRRSFLFGVLKDYELNGKTIHTHVVRDQYAARVKSLSAYDAISKEILGRWTYPFCPDSNLMDGQNYKLRGGKLYQEDGVRVGRDTRLKGRVVLGAGTEIGEDSLLVNSILGRRCNIGSNVHITNAYLWDDVVVKDYTRIVGPAVIANRAILGEKTTVSAGALMSFGAQVEDASSIPDVKISRTREGVQSSTALDDDSDASSDASLRLTYKNNSSSRSQSSISTLASSDVGFGPADTSRRSSFRSDPSDDTTQNRDFHIEATASILDGLTKGDAADTIFLELNGYRMSVDASQHEVRRAVVTAIMKRIFTLGSEDTSPREAVQQIFTNYKSLVDRIILDKAADEKPDQVDFLLLIQKEVVGKANGGQLLLFVAKEVYDQDIVEEDGVLQWWEDDRGSAGEMATVRGLTEQFITFLKEAEEDEESEGDDDEADESE